MMMRAWCWSVALCLSSVNAYAAQLKTVTISQQANKTSLYFDY